MKEWGACSKLSDLTGLDRTTFYLWLGRMRRASSYTPTLEAILSFCYACNLTPLQLMTAPDSLLHAVQNGAPAREPRPHRSKRNVDRKRAWELIQAVLDGREELTGVMQLARRLGHHQSLLWQYFPQECALIAQRYQGYQKQRRKERETRVCEEIRQTVITLHVQNIFPSHHKVRALLSDPNLMRMPEASAIWHAVRRELGLER